MSSKHSCPECGKRHRFTRYIDNEREVSFPNYVGRCDREQKCGYHFTPKQYFDCNPQQWDQQRYRDYKPPSPVAPKPTSYVPPEMVAKTLMRSQGHHLFSFLSSIFGAETTDAVLRKYRVTQSTLWEGATLFWQLDSEGRARTGKIMLYDPKSGRRVKREHSLITWVHSRLNMPDYNLKQCFFGEHLLSSDTKKTVAIVESEKTALVASFWMPNYIWLATGGKNGCLKSDAIEVLAGRKVVLFPDLGATEYWRSKLPLFEGKNINVKIFDELENSATEEQRNEGYDLADFLLDGNLAEVLLQRLIARNPAIESMIEKLHLKLET